MIFLVAYAVGAILWGWKSYRLLGAFWWGPSEGVRVVTAILCGVLWLPSWAHALYREFRP